MFSFLVSKRDVMNQQLNSTAMSVLNEIGSSVTVVATQSNTLNIVGNKEAVNISNLDQGNAATINVTALIASVASGTAQSKLEQQLTAAVQQKGGTLGFSSNEESVKNVVHNMVNQYVSNKNFVDIKTNVAQSNEVNVVANMGTVVVESVKQTNEFQAITKLVQTMSSSILTELESKGILDSKTLQENADIFAQLSNMINNAMWAFILLVIVVVIAFAFTVKYAFGAFEKVVDVSGTSITSSFTAVVNNFNNTITSSVNKLTDPTVIVVLAGAIFGGIALSSYMSKSGFSPAYGQAGSDFVHQKNIVNNTSPDTIPDIAMWESLV